MRRTEEPDMAWCIPFSLMLEWTRFPMSARSRHYDHEQERFRLPTFFLVRVVVHGLISCPGHQTFFGAESGTVLSLSLYWHRIVVGSGSGSHWTGVDFSRMGRTLA